MRSRPERCAAALAAALFAVVALPGTATAAELDVVAVVTSADDRTVSLVADVQPPATPVRRDSFTVRAGTVNLPALAAPIFSDQLAMGLVVDASEVGGAALQPGLSGAANLLLQAPAGARTAIVADTTPPALASPLRAGPADQLFALSAVQAGGVRQTSDAISLALRQLSAATGPRVLLLYTGASYAGDEAADALADRLTSSHTVLVVVSTSPDTGYWREVANATGGLLVAAQRASVIAAFDQVADVLRSRYLVTFPSPERLPARVTVQAGVGGETLTADAIIPTAEPAAAPRSERSNTLWLVALGAGVLTIVAGAATLAVARRVQPAAPPP
jgi:hypothetical protein